MKLTNRGISSSDESSERDVSSLSCRIETLGSSLISTSICVLERMFCGFTSTTRVIPIYLIFYHHHQINIVSHC